MYLTKEGYRPYPAATDTYYLGRQVIIDKLSGQVVGPFNLEWERIRVVKTSPLYNVFMTRGYARDGTPVNEIIVSKPTMSDVTQFVSIDLLTGADILDGTCK